ncbi:MAG: hypothetical protein ABIH85_07295 [Candidatus Omnitrophota bacterium]
MNKKMRRIIAREGIIFCGWIVVLALFFVMLNFVYDKVSDVPDQVDMILMIIFFCVFSLYPLFLLVRFIRWSIKPEGRAKLKSFFRQITSKDFLVRTVLLLLSLYLVLILVSEVRGFVGGRNHKLRIIRR